MRGTGVNPCTIETRGVPNFFCALCRKGSGFDVSLQSFVSNSHRIPKMGIEPLGRVMLTHTSP
jgi:hypothetical protein